MPSSFDRSTSSGRRILSRIAAPFANKGRNTPEFCIQVQDALRQYSPGDIVRGSVIVKVLKPVRVTHIAICLHGFVQVFKTPNAPPGEHFWRTNTSLGRGTGRKSGEYFGNGFATLFEDEVVLCGEGRLRDGSYQFDFEIAFPDTELPSSIEFERGTISYMLTATMTRPATISPVIFSDHRLFFMERIDIAPLLPPKPRTITLEPVSRKTRTRNHAKKLVSSSDGQGKKSGSSQSGTAQESNVSSAPSSPRELNSPHSPRSRSPGERSLDSRVSSNGVASASGSAHYSRRPSDSGTGNMSKASSADKTITATVESLVGGCLRGDNIVVRVAVDHIKHIKSLNGVILTLYRQARVDMHPALPLGPANEGEKKRYEDYYPKSLTGLGGLSLSGAGSSHVFRKDLAQKFMPLMVDPHTLTAEVHAKVRVPEEAFPTISCVPGAMISFKYYVEVVIDIQGKLAGQQKYFSQSGGSPLSPGYLAPLQDYDGISERGMFLPFGSALVDTTPIRRDKSVITCVFEVVVGTVDSERKRGKQRATELPRRDAQPEPRDDDERFGQVFWNANHDQDVYMSNDWHSGQGPQAPHEQDNYYEDTGGDYAHYAEFCSDNHEYLSPPVQDDEDMPEKERLRRAEARLLPSQPPNVGAENEALEGASAPTLETEHAGASSCWVTDNDAEYPAGSSRPQVSYATHPIEPPMSESSSAPRYWMPSPGEGPSAPQNLGIGSSGLSCPPTDDKQELQRRQLQLEASAPPEGASHTGPEADVQQHAASAPTFSHDDADVLFDSQWQAQPSGSHPLPRYER